MFQWNSFQLNWNLYYNETTTLSSSLYAIISVIIIIIIIIITLLFTISTLPSVYGNQFDSFTYERRGWYQREDRPITETAHIVWYYYILNQDSWFSVLADTKPTLWAMWTTFLMFDSLPLFVFMMRRIIGLITFISSIMATRNLLIYYHYIRSNSGDWPQTRPNIW